MSVLRSTESQHRTRRVADDLEGDPAKERKVLELIAEGMTNRSDRPSSSSWPRGRSRHLAAGAGHRSHRRRAPGRPGESLLDPSLTSRVLERLRQPPAPDELAGLTDQERKVLDLIAEGMTNRQIGEQLFLAEKTVKNYVSNLLAKLGMSRRTEAAAFAARLSERRRLNEPEA